MAWKKISTETLLVHPRMQILEDLIELPSGKQTKYIYIKGHPDAAMVIGLNKSGEVYIQKEYSYPPNQWLYQLPGGAQEKNEPIKETARRELAEEAQLAGRLHKIGWFYVDNRRKVSKIFVFVATDTKQIETADTADEEEIFEHYWFKPNTINDMIRNGEIVNYTLLAGWSLFQNSKFYPQV